MIRIILASQSPDRREMLEKTGIPFEVIPSTYEEDMTLDMPPRELCVHLARGKAENVAEQYPDAVVIGADTFIIFHEHLLGKPHTRENAIKMLKMLNGKEHSIVSGYCVMQKSTGKTFSGYGETKMFFKNSTDKEIEDYVDTNEPLKQAGAYKMRGRGRELVDHFEGSESNISGFPLEEILEILKEFEE